MSAPRIKVVADAIGDGYAPFVWYCTAWHRGNTTGGETYTIAAASNAGRAHLASFHTAQMPQVAHGDPEPAHVAPGPHTARPGHDWTWPCCDPIELIITADPALLAKVDRAPDDEESPDPWGGANLARCGAPNCRCNPDPPCCTTPMQHAHNHSREDC